MQIILNPVRLEEQLTLRAGTDVLEFNSQTVDLLVYDHDAFPCNWIVSAPVKMASGWQVQIILPHGADAPEETRFPVPIEVTGSGPVALPPYAAPTPEMQPWRH